MSLVPFCSDEACSCVGVIVSEERLRKIVKHFRRRTKCAIDLHRCDALAELFVQEIEPRTIELLKTHKRRQKQGLIILKDKSENNEVFDDIATNEWAVKCVLIMFPYTPSAYVIAYSLLLADKLLGGFMLFVDASGTEAETSSAKTKACVREGAKLKQLVEHFRGLTKRRPSGGLLQQLKKCAVGWRRS